MAYRIRINVTNQGTQQRQVVIYGGTVFEVEDPISRVQNLVATGNTRLTVAPGQSTAIEIDAWCLNERFAPPDNTPMRPTVLATVETYTDQQHVWREMNQRH